MPTPFMHLHIAEQLCNHPRLQPGTGELFHTHLPALQLGSVVADFQAICDVKRVSTHFYEVPPTHNLTPYARMFEKFPTLAHTRQLGPDRAVLVAAYAAHLLFDIKWYNEVLEPFFFRPVKWTASRRNRFMVHNTLLSYLDREAYAALTMTTSASLGAGEPAGWLPFADPTHAKRWQALLVEQLEPGAAIQTVEIYAKRLKIPPQQFADQLNDPQWMSDNVFRRAPLDAVRQTLSSAVDESLELVTEYLAPLCRLSGS